MTVAFGLLGGVGLLLIASPLLWPAGDRAEDTRPRRNSRLRDRLAAAGLGQTTSAVFLLVSALLGIAVGAVALAVTALPALGAIVGAFAALLPNAVLGWRIRSRR